MATLPLLALAILSAEVQPAPAVDGARTTVLSWRYEAVPVRYSTDWPVQEAIAEFDEGRLEPKDAALFVRGQIELSFEPFQFVMVEESCEPWFNGNADYISTSGVQFYDGETLLYWSADAHGHTPPPIQLNRNKDGWIVEATTKAAVEGIATATPSPRKSLMNYPRLGHLTGIDWLLRIDPLQDFRETGFNLRHFDEAWTREAASGDAWSAEIPSPDGDYVETVAIEIDPIFGLARSVVRKSTRVASNTDNKYLSVGQSRDFRRALAVREAASQADDDERVALLARSPYFPRVLPSSVVAITELFGRGDGYHITLSDIDVTERPTDWVHPYLPVNSVITDADTGETSRILHSFEDDAQSIADFLASNRIAAVPPSDGRLRAIDRPNSSVSLVLWLNVIGLVALVAWLVWKSRKSNAGMVLLAISIIPGTTHADEHRPEAAEGLGSQRESATPTAASALDRIAAKANVIAISSCGFRATVCVLELAQTGYDADLVATMIDVHQEGIRLADIHSTVVAHGLRSEIRKHVGTAALYEALRPGELFLLPVPIDAQLTMHYVVVVREDLTTVLVVNPGIVVRRCTSANQLYHSLNRTDDVTGLLISRPPTPKKNAGMAGAVKVVRESSGKSAEPQPGIASISCRLTNTSDKTIVCSRIGVSCGCLSTETHGWLLQPRESRIIEGRYVDSANGDQSIEVAFADGTQLVLDVPISITNRKPSGEEGEGEGGT